MVICICVMEGDVICFNVWIDVVCGISIIKGYIVMWVLIMVRLSMV